MPFIILLGYIVIVDIYPLTSMKQSIKMNWENYERELVDYKHKYIRRALTRYV